MPIPARLALVLTGAWLVCAIVASVSPASRVVWWFGGGALIVLSAVDAADARRRARGLTVTRTLAPILAVGRRHDYQVRVRADRPISLTLIDVLPLEGEPSPGQAGRADARGGSPSGLAPTPVALPRGTRGARVPLSVVPLVRGRHGAGVIVTRVGGGLRLWEWQRRHVQPGVYRVFPDFRQAAGGSVEAIDLRVPPVGARRAPRRGHGLEFKELRDYREGDALRLVDWKATARRGRPITREYEDQRDQQLLLVLDCGWRLRAHDGALSHFDHVLNAALRLAAVALAQGDAVGCATIAHDEPRLLLPRKSRAALQHLVQGLYDLQPGHRVPDYLADARALHDRLRRRSLVVLLTAVRDEDEDQLLAAAQLLRRRHQVTVATLRETVLDDLLTAPVDSLNEAARWASTLEYVQARQAVIGRLRQRGVDVLDVAPRRLAQALSDHYWRLKRAGTL